MVIVTKFGGTSLANGRSLEQVVDIMLANTDRRVNVLSAPGKRYKEDTKVTDLLVQIGIGAYDGKVPTQLVDELTARFSDITSYFNIEGFFLEGLLGQLDAKIRKTSADKDEYLDGIKPYGEIIISEIAAEVLRRKDMDAQVYLPEDIGMVTNSSFGNAKLEETSYEKIGSSLKPVLEESNKVVIVPGFYGVDEQGRYTTFQRGGSDLTGAILANTLDAELYENWTDTNGIMRADPRIVSNPDVIARLTYKEARELAYSGAEILHPDTLIPLIAKNIPLNVRNTFDQSKEGTYIAATKKTNGNVVEGIAHQDGFTMMYIEKIGMNEETGYLSKLMNIFSEEGVSIDQITTSVDSVAIAVASKGNNGRIGAVREGIIRKGLVDNSNGVDVGYDRSMVCIVGEGMRYVPGVLQRLSSALTSEKINIETVYQGPSERNIIFGLDQKDAVRAVQAVYNLYFAKQPMQAK
jgi:aspartate kinase|tara:strand:+ start:344 stop:1738 length:1395 start_codon:yes stop_codon:yes gene_type:complete